MNKQKIVIFVLILFMLLMNSSIFFTQDTSIAKEGEPTKIYKISWPPVTYAVSYVVQISKDPKFRLMDNIYEIETDKNYLEIALPYDTFYIRIAGRNIMGEIGTFSDVIKIVVENKLSSSSDETIFEEELITEETTLEKDDNIYIQVAGNPYEEIEEENPDITPDIKMEKIKPIVFEYPDDISANLYYYHALCHYQKGKERLAIFYFNLVYKISEHYIPKFKTEPKKLKFSNGEIYLYSDPSNYILDDLIINLLKEYFENAKKMEQKNELEKALAYYRMILTLDPYNSKALEKIYAISYFLDNN